MVTACALHILVKTKKEGLALKVKLDGGADFPTLSKKYSICSSKKQGSEFRPGQMIKAFYNVVFKKPILKVHGPIKNKLGYHLIKTTYRN